MGELVEGGDEEEEEEGEGVGDEARVLTKVAEAIPQKEWAKFSFRIFFVLSLSFSLLSQSQIHTGSPSPLLVSHSPHTLSQSIRRS